MIHNHSRREFLVVSAAATAAGLLGTLPARAAEQRTVVVWSEATTAKEIYPNDINDCIVDGLKQDLQGWNAVRASLTDPDQGISDELLAKTDVLVWWGHKKHNHVKDALVDKIVKRVKEDGMGFISLHSSHFAKPNKKLMGTPCTWGAYIGDTVTLKVIVKDDKHPIAEGIKEFTIARIVTFFFSNFQGRFAGWRVSGRFKTSQTRGRAIMHICIYVYMYICIFPSVQSSRTGKPA